MAQDDVMTASAALEVTIERPFSLDVRISAPPRTDVLLLARPSHNPFLSAEVRCMCALLQQPGLCLPQQQTHVAPAACQSSVRAGQARSGIHQYAYPGICTDCVKRAHAVLHVWHFQHALTQRLQSARPPGVVNPCMALVNWRTCFAHPVQHVSACARQLTWQRQ